MNTDKGTIKDNKKESLFDILTKSQQKTATTTDSLFKTIRDTLRKDELKYRYINVGYNGTTLMDNVQRVVIYDGTLDNRIDREEGYGFLDGSICFHKDTWMDALEKLHPFAIIVSLVYGKDCDRKELISMHGRKKLGIAVSRIAKTIKRVGDRETARSITIKERLAAKEKYKSAALLLSFAFGFMNEIKYNNVDDIRNRISNSTSRELQTYINDMINMIDNCI